MKNISLRQSVKTHRGFALLEILIALAIVGVALPALMLRMQSIANTTEFIESRTIAYWIAENKLEEFNAEQRLQKSVSKMRKDQDTLEFDGQEWHWSVQVEELELGELLAPAKMYRATIEVGIDPEKPLASLVGFLGE